MPPAFDIVIPTWNRRAMLMESVESALRQTLSEVRVVVVDNASNDGTVETLRARYGGRVEVHAAQDHVPYQANLNRCVSLLEAEHGLILHDDDLLDPDYARQMLDLFGRCPPAAMAIGSARPRLEPDAPFRSVTIRPPFAWYRRLGHAVEDGAIVLPAGALADGLIQYLRLCPYWPSVCARRQALQAGGGFAEDLGTLLDYEAWMRLGARHPVVLSPLVVCTNRFHGSMMTNRLLWPRTQAFEKDILVMARRLRAILDRPPTRAEERRFLAKALYPVMLGSRSERRAQYDRYLADSGYAFAELLEEARRELDDSWRLRGWRGPLGRLGWESLRLWTRLRRWTSGRDGRG